MQINIATAVIGAISTVLASAFIAWGAASGTANNKVAEIDKKVAEVTITENLHYSEIQKQLTSIDAKLDRVLGNKTSLK